jgi:hypothetical protein
MSRRTVSLVVTTSALALLGGVGVWAAAAAPAAEVPPAVVRPVDRGAAPSATAAVRTSRPPAKAQEGNCALCLASAD